MSYFEAKMHQIRFRHSGPYIPHCTALRTLLLFMADCKAIALMYHLVPNIQDGSRKPEVQITYP